MDDLYVDAIIDRYRNPLHKGWITETVQTQSKKAHNPSCGDQFELIFQFDAEKVVDAKWRGDGCAISTVSIDCFCEWAIGKSATQLHTYDKSLIQLQTGVNSITPAREKCLYLPLALGL